MYGFFASAGVFFFRFLRLAAVQWIVYAALFGWLHPLLFDRLYPDLIRDLTVERAWHPDRGPRHATFRRGDRVVRGHQHVRR